MVDKTRDGGNGRFKKKLISYSVAAGATLALAQPAAAEINYSGPQNLLINPGTSPIDVDLNGDAINDVTFTAYSEAATHFVRLKPTCSNEALKVPVGPSYFQRLPNGYPIGPNASDWENPEGALQIGNDTGLSEGNFIGQKGHIGVKVHVSATQTTHYCWIQYEGIGTGPIPIDRFSHGRIIDWACESRDNGPILAGNTIDAPPEAVPTLNQWGLMILAGLILAGATRRLKQRESDLG